MSSKTNNAVKNHNHNNGSSSIIGNIIFTITTSLQLTAVDYLINYLAYHHNPSTEIYIKFAPVLTILIAIISFMRSNIAIICIQSVFAFFIFLQSVHYMYFGSAINSAEIHEFFVSFHDISGDFGMLKGFILLSLLPVALIAVFTFLSLYFGRKRIKNKFAALFTIVIIIAVIIINITKPAKEQGAMPSRSKNIYRNTVNSTIYYLTHTLPETMGWRKDLAAKKYIPPSYTLETKNKNVQIIIIQGESLTLYHMGVYGYKRNTTPFLSKLVKQDNVFKFKGIPMGPKTDISLPQFYNMIPRPNGIAAMLSGKINLFSMAKNNGFTTTFSSMQSADGLDHIVVYFKLNSIDNYSDADILSAKIPGMKKSKNILDQELATYMKKNISFTKRNFLVLHMYGSHSPYKDRYPSPKFNIYKNKHEDSFRQKQVNAYDNTVHYTDSVIKSIYQYIKKNTRRPTYIIFTSDHGEGLGEQHGYYGHGSNKINHVVRVPIIIAGLNGADLSFMQKQKQQPKPKYLSHFELTKIIGYLLGYNTKPIFDKSNGYIINGGILDGSEGFRKIKPKDLK